MAFLLGATACTPRPSPPTTGALLETVVPGEPGALAGLRPGDVVVGWSSGRDALEVRRPIGSLFDLERVELEEAPRRPVTLVVVRRGVERPATLGTDAWGVRWRPVLAPAELEQDRSARGRLEDGEVSAAVAQWGELAQGRAAAGDLPIASWLVSEAGRSLLAAAGVDGPTTPAQALFVTARRLAAESGERFVQASIENKIGEAWEKLGQEAAAEASYRRSLELRRQSAPGSLAVVDSLLRLEALGSRGELPGGEGLLDRALVLVREAAPSSLLAAEVMRRLGRVAFLRDDGVVAERWYRRALELRRRLAPETAGIGTLLANLGLAAKERGDLVRAEGLYRRSLEVFRRVAPRHERAAYTANYLGLLTRDKGDYETARLYMTEGLEIFRSNRPESLEVAGMLNNLGTLASRQDRLEEAAARYRESLELREKLAPETPAVAASLNNLGAIARRQGDLQTARAYLERALALKERLLPGSFTHANTLTELGELARETGDWEEAERLHREALEIRRSLAPTGEATAESLIALGETLRDAGHLDEARQLWGEGLEILDARQENLVRSPLERSLLASRFQDYYRGYAELLHHSGRDLEAFEVFERSRARGLRAMLAHGPAGREPPSASPSGETALVGERALGAMAIRAALDPGTLLLAYSAGAERTLLFIMAAGDGLPPALRVRELPLGRAELARRVRIFRSLIERGRTTPRLEQALIAQGRRLFDDLLGPAAAEVSGARRLLVVADGPLATLPFSALVRRAEPLEFVVTWKPIYFAVSGTVFARLRASRRRREPGVGRLAAFGDPMLAPAGQGGSETDRPIALAAARSEVRRLGGLFPGQAETYVGAEATEARVRSVAPTSRYLHFACHASLDPRFPLNSALLLARGNGQDGRLTGWEVMKTLRLDADLVTLSACETGLGRDLGGEGILGLSEAFQAAGARSVVVSLWAVSDRSTAELMARFYHHLREGRAVDEALQAAQSELLAAPVPIEGGTVDGRPPFYWAAFEVRGDCQ